MRKAGSILALFIFGFLNYVSAQVKRVDSDSCYQIKDFSGVVVFVYSKAQIKSNKKNQRARKSGKKYSLNIDNAPKMFFVKSPERKNSLVEEVEKCLTGKSGNLFIPYAAFDYYGFEKFNLSCLKSLHESPDLPPEPYNANYFSTRKIDNYYFKFLVLNATWAKVIMNQNEIFELATKESQSLDSSKEFYDIFILKY
jgi:hypothetical protein